MEVYYIIIVLFAVYIVSVVLFTIINYYFYKKYTGSTKVPLWAFLLLLIFTAVLPGTFLCFVFFSIYRQLVSFLLLVRYRSKYGGLLEGNDSIYTLGEKLDTPVHSLFIIQWKSKPNAESSFFDFVKETLSLHIPPFITVMMPVRPLSKIISIMHATGQEKKLRCQNRNSVGLVQVPVLIDCHNVDSSMKNRLQAMIKHERYQNIEANYWKMHFVSTLFPKPFVRLLAERLNNSTILFTNLPGFSAIEVFDGCPVLHIIGWTQQRETTGISFNVFTYRNRLELGLSIDKTLISSQRAIDTILDDVGKYLSLLDCQTEKADIEINDKDFSTHL